jgi:hypothetical protein
MELNWILFLVLLIIYPIVWYFGTHSKSSVIDQPLIFHNSLFVLFCNLLVLVFVVISAYLIFISWKTFLLLILIIATAGFLKGLLSK